MKRNLKSLTDSLVITCTIFEQDLCGEQDIGEEATKVMGYLEDEISPELCDQLRAMLLGFSRSIQAEMAADMLMFVEDQLLFTTGCNSVDYVLEACYKWIAEEKGLILKN